MNTQKLRGKIVECGYTQRTLAPLLNMSENTLGNKLNGKAKFDLDEATQMCKVLGITDADEMASIFFA